MTEADLRERLASLFRPGGRFSGQYDPPTDVQVVVPAIQWQAFIFPRGSASARVIRVYALDNGNAILERFWSNEVRALHRIASRRHRLLPQLVDAAHVRDLGLGYLILEDAGNPLEENPACLEELRGSRLGALKVFADLTDAVAVLHTEGMVHRSISPRALLTSGQATLKLDGFQMSAFLAGILRGGATTEDGAAAFVPANASSAVCFAPERLNWLLNGAARSMESFSCDVFGLGMVAISWFAGPLPDDECQAVVVGGRYDEAAHIKVINSAHRLLRSSALPTELRRVLEQMTAPSAANRMPSAIEVSATLGRIHGGLVAQLRAASDSDAPPPRLVYFLRETIEHLYKDGLGRTSPQEPDETEYAELVAADLEGGTLAWSPRGFAPWVRNNQEQAGRARIVLFGRRYAYFCQYLNDGARDEDTRVLLVKYPTPLHVVRALRDAPRQQTLPPVRALFFDPNRRSRPIPEDVPSWKDSVEQVRVDLGGEIGSAVAAVAKWLVGYQEALSAAFEFNYERIDVAEGNGPSPIVLRSTGLARIGELAERVPAFLELLRREKLIKPMGEVFQRLHGEGIETGDLVEFVVGDPSGRDRVRLIVDEAVDADTVRFRSIEGDARVPATGRVRPDDFATRVALERQDAAAQRLAERHDLLAQLKEPRGIRLDLTRADMDPQLVTASVEAAKLVSRILDEEPLFVVQGPPGTGKTFVGSHVIKSILKTDPLARILVSAQSNAATDNILESVEEKVAGGADAPLLVRHTSTEARPKLSSKAALFTVDEQVANARKKIVEGATGSGPLAPIQKQWRRLAKDQDLDAELYSRVPRAANVVFATCIGSGADADALRLGQGFDWVVIEEAAHAWLSEIAVPLVQGDRWLLIGDHAQLPAHGADDVERVFRRDLEEQVTVEATGSMPSESWHPFLSHFRHLMEAPISSGHWTEPRAAIQEQRRMASDIGDLVSTAYYEGKLRTHPDARRSHGLRGGGLGFLEKTGLAWLDTSVYGQAGEETGFENRLELHLIRTLLSRVDRFPLHDPKVPALAILSPYKRQLRLLQKEAKNHRDVTDECFYTVDSVQGRQAEVVIVSLARNNVMSSPAKAIGFLRAPERANVMFSRARRLLIIVGSLSHFARFPSTHWGAVVDYLRADAGRFIIDPKAALGFNPPGRMP